jgi:hypothetical protein
MRRRSGFSRDTPIAEKETALAARLKATEEPGGSARGRDRHELGILGEQRLFDANPP